VKFDMFSKIVVKGEGQAPLYKFLTSSETNPKFPGRHHMELREVPHRQGRLDRRAIQAEDPAGL
jgi:glutathione peroxidase-family protein